MFGLFFCIFSNDFFRKNASQGVPTRWPRPLPPNSVSSFDCKIFDSMLSKRHQNCRFRIFFEKITSRASIKKKVSGILDVRISLKVFSQTIFIEKAINNKMLVCR